MFLKGAIIVAGILPSLAQDVARIKFDFNWRFLLGDGPNLPSMCNSTSFNATVGTCSGLDAFPDAATPEACIAACCGMNADGESCFAWQFSDGNTSGTSASHCWAGKCDTPQHNNRKGKNVYKSILATMWLVYIQSCLFFLSSFCGSTALSFCGPVILWIYLACRGNQ